MLLLDEPTAGLDAMTEALLVEELLAGTKGKTVLLVTHDQDLAGRADRKLTLSGGTGCPARRRPACQLGYRSPTPIPPTRFGASHG